MSEIHSMGPDDSSGPGTFYLNPTVFKAWKKYFQEGIFHNKVQLTDKEVRQMATNQINFISSQMGHVLNRALQIQKILDQKIINPESPDEPYA